MPYEDAAGDVLHSAPEASRREAQWFRAAPDASLRRSSANCTDAFRSR